MATYNPFRKSTRLIMLPDDRYDINCVMSRLDLKSQLELFCAHVKHPVTMFCLYDQKENGGMERIDSSLSSVALHFCCETFRICAGISYCRQSDRDHASLFKGENGEPMPLSEMQKMTQKNIDEFYNTVYPSTKYYNPKTPKPKFVPREGFGGYIVYHCPILGYIELIFPVIVSGLVLGAIFCGQVQLKNDDVAAKIRNASLDAGTYLPDFERYLKKHPEKQMNNLINDLRTGEDVYKSDRQYPMDEEQKNNLPKEYWVNPRRTKELDQMEYEKLIEDVVEALTMLYDALCESMQSVRKRYIARIIKDAAIEFYNRVRGISPEALIPNYWSCVEESLSIVVRGLSLRDIQVYGALSPHSGIEESAFLSMVVYANSQKLEKMDLKFIKEHFRFAIRNADAFEKGLFLSSDKFEHGEFATVNRKLRQRIIFDQTKEYDSHTEFMNILYYPIHSNLLHSSAFVLSYYDYDRCAEAPLKHMALLDDTKYIKETILGEFYSLSTLVVYAISYFLDSVLQDNTVKLLRFYRHELSHTLLGFNFLNSEYIKDNDQKYPNNYREAYSRYTSLDSKKREDVQDDFISTEEMLKAISTNIELLTKPKSEIRIETQEFWIFKELLYKWENLYRHDTALKNLQFVIPKVSHPDPYRPSVVSDKRLCEQIIYNIVSNAIKYSHWGTKIKIDCIKESSFSPQVLSIVDYGVGIETTRRPYELYFRDVDINQAIEGSGIGLFVVERIADILGFRVIHSCRKISDFNVALMHYYLEGDFKKDEKLKHELMEAYPKVKIPIGAVISDKHIEKPLTKAAIEASIGLPTYEVRFEVIM
ncbi:MAG: ATP-binding protein [Oscillospiraceae bacterium]|nr:ATP-binding protein [Oscillospiraceae bacterium]